MGLRMIDPGDDMFRVPRMANEYLAMHGLDKLGWRFEFANTKSRLGACDHEKKVIEFSRYYTEIPDSEIRDTLLHEIAHALVGPEHGHDAVWRRMCVKIGAKPERLAPPHIKSSAKPNYKIKCPSCGKTWMRYRMKRSNFGAICRCGGEVKIYRIIRK